MCLYFRYLRMVGSAEEVGPSIPGRIADVIQAELPMLTSLSIAQDKHFPSSSFPSDRFSKRFVAKITALTYPNQCGKLGPP